jgi:hypothetical protein
VSHGRIDLIGPGAVVLLVLFFAIWLASLYVLVDGVRRKQHDFTGVREGRWFYVIPESLYFVVFALAQIAPLSAAAPWVGYAQVLAAPFALAHQVAYLLRVVFPTPARLAARAQARAAADEPDEIGDERRD